MSARIVLPAAAVLYSNGMRQQQQLASAFIGTSTSLLKAKWNEVDGPARSVSLINLPSDLLLVANNGTSTARIGVPSESLYHPRNWSNRH
jgi:hypothetical protein